jgi:DNA (cytosine-5)-methyltransferase 1
MWDAIQDVLVQNSKFLTLIDIYGHYANRGDTVTIQTDIIGGATSPLVRALRFFGDSANCGKAMSRVLVNSSLAINGDELDKLIPDLRSMRFDIRTRKTHPTIAPGMVLCTYPFPLLSDKAHLERRLKADSFDPDDVGQPTLF